MPDTSQQQSLQANSLVKLIYTAAGITFAKANAENIAIAKTQSGIGELTDVIEPVTLASGKITVDGTAVTGYGTSFTVDFRDGQYLFYYNRNGEPVLLGQILSRGGPFSMTLTSNATVNLTAQTNCGMANTILGTSENLLIRIPVVSNGVNVIMPNWGAYRVIESPLEVNAYNNSEFSNLEQYSIINSPQTPATPPLTSISYTITPVYNFQSYEILENGQKVTKYFQIPANFPSFCFAILNPFGNSNLNLAPNTLYKVFASERFDLNGINVTTGFSQNFLTLAGY
jgi:hypothetical protein